MLGFVATDAVIAPALLQRLVREAADESFNRITIDGDTSTNDSFVLIATQQRRPCAASTSLDSRPTAARCATPWSRSSRAARAGDRARRRRRDQVHHRARRRRRERRRVPPRGLRDRPFAAGQDGVLRERSEPRPHPRRGRLRRHRRPRPDA